MGHGDGSGRGQGGGSGRGQVQNLTAGGAVATGFTVLMCLCAIPMVMVGAVLVFINPGNPLGLSLLGIATVMAVVGLVLIALLCAGVFIKDKTVSQTALSIPRQGNKSQMTSMD